MNTITLPRETWDPEVIAEQHRKPICDKDGNCIGYSEWADGRGLDWWPHRSLITLQSHRDAMVEQERLQEMALAEYREQCLENGRAIAKKDAALKACVEALENANGNGSYPMFNEAIMQAQESLK